MKLSINVALEIAEIVHEFYPLLTFKFCDFKIGSFTVDDDRMILKGGDPESNRCFGQFVYADLQRDSNNG